MANIIKKRQYDRFTAPMYMRLWRPALLSSFGWALSDMADAVVVGNRLGTVGLAAISLILPVYMINYAIVHGFGIGGSIRFSQALAEGNEENAKRNFTAVVSISGLCSLFIAIVGNILIEPFLALLGTVPADGELYASTKSYLTVLLYASPLFYMSNILNYYLRNYNEEKAAGLGSVVGSIVDITCNISFVLLFNLGTFGAALSTAIGQVVSIVIYVFPFLKKRIILNSSTSTESASAMLSSVCALAERNQ